MADTRCSCGFTETAGETITDHLLDAFVPEDGESAATSVSPSTRDRINEVASKGDAATPIPAAVFQVNS